MAVAWWRAAFLASSTASRGGGASSPRSDPSFAWTHLIVADGVVKLLACLLLGFDRTVVGLLMARVPSRHGLRGDNGLSELVEPLVLVGVGVLIERALVAHDVARRRGHQNDRQQRRPLHHASEPHRTNNVRAAVRRGGVSVSVRTNEELTLCTRPQVVPSERVCLSTPLEQLVEGRSTAVRSTVPAAGGALRRRLELVLRGQWRALLL